MLACLLGLLIGQLWALVPSGTDAPFITPPPQVDPYTEARRSKAILEAQEAAPPNFYATPRSSEAPTVSTRVARYAAVRVIDGDTFDYGGQRIRIADIDTPETNPARCAREADLGGRATRRLDQWLAQGPFDLIAIDRDADRYGRKLRRVERNGRSVGDLLVAEGLARPYGGGRRSGWCG